MTIVNSGEFGARNDGATPISNRRATSDNVPNFSSVDHIWDILGVIAQLVERLNGIQKVGGSIPPGSTRYKGFSAIL